MIIHADPEIVRYIASPRSGFRRGHWYAGMQFDPRINNLLSERDETRHAELRAKMSPGYTGKEVLTIEAKIDQRILDLVKLIQKYIAKNEAFDFSEKTQFFTMDSLTDMAFGFPFGFLTKDEDLYEYNKSSTEFFPVMELATNVPAIWNIISSKFMQAVAGPKAEDRKGLGAIIGVAQKIVAERFKAESEKNYPREPDMIDAFVKHGLTQLEAESESILQILAGSDSTATSIRMAVLYLLTNPHVYAKLRAEIDSAIADGKVSYPVVQNSETSQLRYLQAVIKESLRCWFPLNGLVTMDSPNEGVTINNVYIPPRTQVTLSKYTMLRRRDLFGEDSEMFNPDRWLQKDTAKVKEMDGVMETYFGLGRYSCLGRGIALMELNKVLFEVSEFPMCFLSTDRTDLCALQLFKRFDLGLVNPINTVKSKCHQLHVQKDMLVRAYERSE